MTELERIERKLDYLLSRLEALFPSKPDILLYDWFRTWYDTYKAPNLKKNSLRCIRDTLRLHIQPNIPNVPLKTLTPLDLQNCLNAISSSRMAEYSHNTLTDCMRRAYELGYTDTNLMLSIAKPKHRRTLGHALSVDEQRLLLSLLPKLYHGEIFAFYLYTGCRRSEALALRWDDVDYSRNLIHVNGTKTTNADRYVPIFPKLKTLLCSLPHTAERLFPFSDSTLKRDYEKLRSFCGFDFTIHSLRHTYITRLHEQGVDDTVIQKWVGHSSVTTTQRIYIHVLSDQERLQMQKVTQSDLF